jgi:hypothetical protein
MPLDRADAQKKLGMVLLGLVINVGRRSAQMSRRPAQVRSFREACAPLCQCSDRNAVMPSFQCRRNRREVLAGAAGGR